MSMLRSWGALLIREYREHRMAFLYFPAGILLLLTISSVSGLFTNRARLALLPLAGNSLKLFEIGDLLIMALWFAYLCITLFFYFGDAFAADRRNNAMFFWKSMPVSDLRILAGKFLAGVTLFPVIIYIAGLIGGLVLFALMSLASALVPGFPAIDAVAMLTSYGQIAIFAAVYIMLALLWYAPFFAWVGALSTAFGRWSIPLALLIPVVFSLLEGVIDFGSAPGGSYVISFLKQRLSFSFDAADMRTALFSNAPLDVPGLIGTLIAGVNWPSLLGGLVFAAVVIYAASEYRRRVIT